jgi:PPOX class probable F420-dependent enzyme
LQDTKDQRAREGLPEALLELLRRPSTCYVATTMADGSPQLTQTWVDTDGERILINSVQGFLKVRNVERDPRVAVAVSDPDNPRRYFQVRGRVVEVTTEGAADHIEKLSQNTSARPTLGMGAATRCAWSCPSSLRRSAAWASSPPSSMRPYTVRRPPRSRRTKEKGTSR